MCRLKVSTAEAQLDNCFRANVKHLNAKSTAKTIMEVRNNRCGKNMPLYCLQRIDYKNYWAEMFRFSWDHAVKPQLLFLQEKLMTLYMAKTRALRATAVGIRLVSEKNKQTILLTKVHEILKITNCINCSLHLHVREVEKSIFKSRNDIKEKGNPNLWQFVK